MNSGLIDIDSSTSPNSVTQFMACFLDYFPKMLCVAITTTYAQPAVSHSQTSNELNLMRLGGYRIEGPLHERRSVMLQYERPYRSSQNIASLHRAPASESSARKDSTLISDAVVAGDKNNLQRN